MDQDFEGVYRAYGGTVFGYLVRLTRDRHLAEELCQETFVRYLRHRGTLRCNNGSLGPWLFRVATRLVLDSRRRRRPVPLQHEPIEESTVESAAETRDLGRRVRREIDTLPPELRATFLLRAHHELTYAQIGAATGVSERAAKDRFRRGRDLLLKRLAPLIREIRS